MLAPISDDYISNREWLRDVAAGKELILRGVSALEYHELFCGYVGEKQIDVYAKSKGGYDNVNYCVVETFDGIDYVEHTGVLYTSFSQTVNDMLNDENCDDLALTEALSNYYFSHSKSFDGIEVKPENTECFNELKEWAVDYYNDGY